jgi:hypothetical protein
LRFAPKTRLRNLAVVDIPVQTHPTERKPVWSRCF